MSDSETEVLNRTRDLIKAQREQIVQFGSVWKDSVKTEQDDFKRVTAKTFLRLMEITDDIYRNLEAIHILDSSLRERIDILKDTIMKLPDVKENSTLQSEIEDAFSGYQEKYDKQLNSFTRGEGLKKI